ncbi:hypothetical protein [Fodinibius sp.]|uniref:hypothetical protein n=1 Tax=Fodinibius sp. TaxID=1872440 RepID=UPI003563B4F7
MNTESIFGALLPFLMTAVLLSYSMEGVSPSATVSFDSSQQSSLCKNILQTSLVKAKDHPSGVKQSDEQSTPSQGATTVSSSCNTSLQVIPVEKQHLAGPHESSLLFPPYTSDVPSQAFVFQEPDPPQTI